MLDLRAPLIPLSAALGVVIASMVWLLFAGHSRVLADLGAMEQQLAAPQPAISRASIAQDDAAGRILAAPLFALTTGPGAVTDVAVRLDGVAMTPTRRAALVSIDGKPAQWMTVGQALDGVTLMEVQSAKVSVDTATGFKDVGLWDAPLAANGSAQSPPGAPAPAGFRLPPASAPGGR